MLKISLWAHCGHTGIIKLMKKLLGIVILSLLISLPVSADIKGKKLEAKGNLSFNSDFILINSNELDKKQFK